MFISRTFGNEEPGDQFKSSVFRNADPSNVERPLLEGNRGHVLSQAKSELMRQEHQVESLNNLSLTYGNMLMLKDCNYTTHNTDAQHGYIESRREKVRLQEE